MTKPKEYILNEVKIIEKECLEKGISPIEWIEKYAKVYRRRYCNSSKQERLTAPHPFKSGSLKTEEVK